MITKRKNILISQDSFPKFFHKFKLTLKKKNPYFTVTLRQLIAAG